MNDLEKQKGIQFFWEFNKYALIIMVILSMAFKSIQPLIGWLVFLIIGYIYTYFRFK